MRSPVRNPGTGIEARVRIAGPTRRGSVGVATNIGHGRIVVALGEQPTIVIEGLGERGSAERDQLGRFAAEVIRDADVGAESVVATPDAADAALAGIEDFLIEARPGLSRPCSGLHGLEPWQIP